MAATIQNTNVDDSSNANNQDSQPTSTIKRVRLVMSPLDALALSTMEADLHYQELQLIFPISIAYFDKGLDAKLVASTLLEHIQKTKKHFSIKDDIVWSVLIDQFSSRVTTHKEFFVELVGQWHQITQAQDLNTQRQIQSQVEDQKTEHVTCTQVLCTKAIALQKVKHDQKKADDFYLVAAYLISHSIVDVDELYPSLSLADGDMLQDYHKFEKNMRYQARCLRRTHHVEDIQVFINHVNSGTMISTGTDVANTGSNYTGTRSGHQLPNQKRGIINALLAIGGVVGALTMMKKIPPFTQTPYPETADLICRLIRVMISDLDIYPSKSPDKEYPAYSFDQWTVDQLRCLDGKDMVDCVSPLLEYVGSHLHRHPDIVSQVCRRMEYEMIELKEAARNEANFERFTKGSKRESQSEEPSPEEEEEEEEEEALPEDLQQMLLEFESEWALGESVEEKEEEALPEDLQQMLLQFESEWALGESVEEKNDVKVKSERKEIEMALFELESHWVFMTKATFLPALMLLEPKDPVIRDVRRLMKAVRKDSQRELFDGLEDVWYHLKSSRKDRNWHLNNFMGGMLNPPEILSGVWHERVAQGLSTSLVRVGTRWFFAPMKVGKLKTPTPQNQVLVPLSVTVNPDKKRRRSYQDDDDTSTGSHHGKRSRHKREKENNEEQPSDTRRHDHKPKRSRSEEDDDAAEDRRHKRTRTHDAHKSSNRREKENNEEQPSDTRRHDHKPKRSRSEEDDDAAEDHRHKRTRSHHAHKSSDRREKDEVSHRTVRDESLGRKQHREAKANSGSTGRQELREVDPTLVNTQESLLVMAPEDVKPQDQGLDLMSAGLFNLENSNTLGLRRSW